MSFLGKWIFGDIGNPGKQGGSEGSGNSGNSGGSEGSGGSGGSEGSGNSDSSGGTGGSDADGGSGSGSGRGDNGLEFDTSRLTRSQSKAVESAENNINDHLTERDISGAQQELEGNLIEKGNGEYWDHINEVKDAYRGISRARNTLEGSLKNPNLEADVRSFLQSEVDKITSYMNRLETIFELYGGIE